MNLQRFLRINMVGIAYMWAILFVCLIPAKMKLVKLGFFEIDKLAHFCIYLSLTCVNFIGLEVSKRKGLKGVSPFWVSIIVSLIWGMLVECLQVWLPTGRYFEWYDVLANILGVLVALPVMRYLGGRLGSLVA